MSEKKKTHRKGPGNNFHKHHNKHNKQGFANVVQLSETEVGISEFVSITPGFSGIIKARFSDFHVNEIDEDGNVAKLNDLTIPDEFTEPETVCEDLDNVPCPCDAISAEIWSKILAIAKGTSDESARIDITSLNKEERSQIHREIKGCLGDKISASTISTQSEKFIEFKRSNGNDNRTQWPANVGEYVHFIVYKESIDTMEATFRIANALKMKTSHFNYAGVKDRRAKTTQWFSVRKVAPPRLLERTKPIRNIHIGNVAFKDQPLKLGQLRGNRFRVALRNVTAQEHVIAEAMESLKSDGFINYYGLQRFGNDKEVTTFDVGVKLLLGQWKDAVNLILRPKKAEDPIGEVAKAKKLFAEGGDATKAAKELTHRSLNTIEGKLLTGLSKNHNNDYVNALENIPRNMRLMYMHAFQSLIWNRIVSRRVREFGLKTIAGDLVFKEDEEGEDGDDDEEKRKEVKVLTEADLADYSIFDVVLPLPGYDVVYPENEIKNEYRNLLEEYGLSLEMSKQKVKTYTLSGAYRKILGQVEALTWKTVGYNQPNDNLIQSDYEEMRNGEAAIDDPNGKYRALVMDFRLKSSSYATMALREVLKMDTSTASQAKLNNYFDASAAEERTTSSTTTTTTTTSKITEEETLLDDKEKLQQFKELLFQTGAQGEKRRIDGDAIDGEQVEKKLKVE